MEQIILFLFLIIFPFGQIIRIGILQPIDIVAGVAAFWVIYKKYKEPEIFFYFKDFLLFASFSWIFALFYFKQIEVLYGLLYLLRLFAFFYFFVLVTHFARSAKNKKLLVDGLLVVSIVSGVFGWIQFFLVPNFKPLFFWGWDEHLFRLAGTFLDPSFLGIILVLGFVIALYKSKYFTAGFLSLSALFTYSRASYLALLGALVAFAFFKNSFKKYILWGLIFVGFIFFLPIKNNKILSFTRSFSVLSRIENYKETLSIFKSSPIFGIGYNNMCFARNKLIHIESYSSHACSGSDSSLLFVLATTGISGFFIFVRLILNLWRNSSSVLKTSFIALFIHSLFSNSLFYPWSLGFLMVLLGTNLRGKIES